MEPHFRLNAQEKFLPKYFERWLWIFAETVYENFSGPYAELACSRANSIAAIMQMKLSQINEGKFD